MAKTPGSILQVVRNAPEPQLVIDTCDKPSV